MSKIRSKTLSTVSTVAINEALLYKRALCASLDLLLACQHSSPQYATDVSSATRPPSLLVQKVGSGRYPVY